MNNLSGFITALVTPFKENLSIDYQSLDGLLDYQIGSGIEALVICGTTGENATLEQDEKFELLSYCVEYAKKFDKKVSIIFGSGSNNTKQAILNSQKAKKLGADALLVVAPYYNKPSQNGIFAHFAAIASVVDCPIILYNVPGRTGVNIEVDTVTKLAQINNIVAIKDAVYDLSRPLKIANNLLKSKDKSGHFKQISGEDATVLAYLASGGEGCISVTSNVFPKMCIDFYQAWKCNDVNKALALQLRMVAAHEAMFCDTNPVPAKYALSEMGIIKPYVRLPLIDLSDYHKQIVNKVIKEHVQAYSSE